MRVCIKQEISYLWKSKTILFVMLALISLAVCGLYGNYVIANENIGMYADTKSSYGDDYESFENDLTSDYKVEEDADEEAGYLATLVTNPLPYEKEMVEQSLYLVGPKYAISAVLEYLSGMVWLVMPMLGIVMATYDNKNMTIRNKTVRHGKVKVAVSKQLVLLAFAVISVAVSTLIVVLGNYIYYKFYIKSVENIEDFQSITLKLNGTIVEKILCVALIAILVAELSFCLATIIKNSLFSYMIIIAYVFINPSLGKYGISSCLSKIRERTFEFYGSMGLGRVSTLSSTRVAVSILIMVCITCIILSIFTLVKRSSYK